jgi:PhzF family phenazine biosynthesis protein
VTRRRIRHVDAFTTTPLEGNPAAVVDGEGLTGELMQRVALNQKLSETVFLLPPDHAANHARLRIFTPARELPFAGHPTVAAAHVLLSEGTVRPHDGEALRLETGAGVVPVEVAGSPPLYTMTQARPQFRDAGMPLDDIAAAVGLARADVLRAECVSTGFYWLVAQVASLDAMLRTRPDMTALARFPDGLSIFAIGAQSPDAGVRVRAFAPAAGVPEDPVTGSANGCIGAFIAKHGLLARDGTDIRYVAEQGIELAQPGRVHVAVSGSGEDLTVRVGGNAVTVLDGELLLPA